MQGREEVRNSDSQEAEAIRQAQRGDANVFELLYRLHSSRVFALCLRMLKNNAEAEDMTQETFLTVFRAILTFRGDSAFSSWLHRVTMNCVLMHIRRKTLAQVSLEEIIRSGEPRVRASEKRNRRRRSEGTRVLHRHRKVQKVQP